MVHCLRLLHVYFRGRLGVHSDEPMRAVTPGQVCDIIIVDDIMDYALLPLHHLSLEQHAVFYDGQQCLGGACIDTVGPSLWQHNQNG